MAKKMGMGFVSGVSKNLRMPANVKAKSTFTVGTPGTKMKHPAPVTAPGASKTVGIAVHPKNIKGVYKQGTMGLSGRSNNVMASVVSASNKKGAVSKGMGMSRKGSTMHGSTASGAKLG